MNFIQTLMISAAVAIVTLVGGLALIGTNQSGSPVGGATESFFDAAGGFRVNGTAVISSVGALSGISLGLNNSGTTTATVYSTTAAKGGRMVLEDRDGAGCSEITVLNGVVAAATVTCP